MSEISFRPIGIINSGHKNPKDVPIQPVYAKGCRGSAVVFPEYTEGLNDLEGFSHIYILFHLHRAGEPKLSVVPFLDEVERGVFSTRAPVRPNQIGLSIVELVGIEDNILHLNGVDVLDGTPLLDIKPYTTRFDCIENTRNGWQDTISDDIADVRGLRNFRKNGQ